jgi:CheY-like chemotaxis protein
MVEAPRVLVVDDERISREATVRQLRAAGFVADAVENWTRGAHRTGT